MKKIIEYKNIKPIYTIDTEGNIENIKTGKSLKYATTSDGYYTVGLQQNDNTRKIFYLHILLAETFLDKPENAEQVNHIDKNRVNNDLSNLEWCTQIQNLNHQQSCKCKPNLGKACKSWGKISRGSENGMSKINEEQCHFICKLLSEGYSRKDVVDMCDFYVTYDIVRFIHARKRWKHISKDYLW